MFKGGEDDVLRLYTTICFWSSCAHNFLRGVVGCGGSVGFEGGFLYLKYIVCLIRRRFVVGFRDFMCM